MEHKVIPYEEQKNPAVDPNDPQVAKTAIELHFPGTFSDKARKVLDYFDGSMLLYAYKGQFVVTDESLELTESGDGTPGHPIGGPRWTGTSLEELEKWLEFIADDYDASGDIIGWESEEEKEAKEARKRLNLIASITIEKANNWFIGTIDGYPYEAKVTEGDSAFGIDNGRIIKLSVYARPIDDSDQPLDELIGYERGWEKYPETPEMEDILDAIVEFFQNHMEKKAQ